MVDELTASKAAYRLTHILDSFSAHHSSPRFPVDVVSLAKEAASVFSWTDPITKVEAADIKSFEGALFPDDERKSWLLLYNSKIRSPGRIRFTQAHELGHYLLHRMTRDSFSCAEKDVVNFSQEETTIESQADSFASTLLMPLNDFREQMGTCSDMHGLSDCAQRYGVSLTAAALRWVRYTEVPAVLVSHRDGFMDWAFSSRSAFKNGAFFRTKTATTAVPIGSLASDESLAHSRDGEEIPASTWFPHARQDVCLREMKVSSTDYDSTLSLLVLPRGASVWAPWDSDRSTRPR